MINRDWVWVRDEVLVLVEEVDKVRVCGLVDRVAGSEARRVPEFERASVLDAV